MNTEKISLARLVPNQDNPRKITDENFKLLVRSILSFPSMLELRPIIIDQQMNILGGNMRTLALQHIANLDNRETRAHLDQAANLTDAEREYLATHWQHWRENPTVPTLLASQLTEQQQREFIIKDNSSFGHWDTERLLQEWQDLPLADWGLASWNSTPATEADENTTQDTIEEEETDETTTDEQEDTETETTPQDEKAPRLPSSLNEIFIIPPFSVLDTRTGYWQQRKKLWREHIGAINGETREGISYSPEMCYPKLYTHFRQIRDTLPVKMNFTQYLDTLPEEQMEQEREQVCAAGVSLFDPVLSEILCQWFTPHANSSICDPFAGDTQKGMVFAILGHRFTGIELRAEQVEANRRNLEGRNLDCSYICDDGRNIRKHIEADTQDLLFSCPPYFDLEQYSNLPEDASNQRTYNAFMQILTEGFRGGGNACTTTALQSSSSETCATTLHKVTTILQETLYAYSNHSALPSLTASFSLSKSGAAAFAHATISSGARQPRHIRTCSFSLRATPKTSKTTSVQSTSRSRTLKTSNGSLPDGNQRTSDRRI